MANISKHVCSLKRRRVRGRAGCGGLPLLFDIYLPFPPNHNGNAAAAAVAATRRSSSRRCSRNGAEEVAGRGKKSSRNEGAEAAGRYRGRVA